MALRVLLADESSTIKKVMQLALQDFGIEVKTVSIGLDVLSVTKNFKPDIVFIDVLLSKKSGYDVCRELKSDAETKAIPVILMWSGFMELDEAKTRESMADRRLEKPFDADILRDMVRELVERTQSNTLSSYLSFPKMPDFKDEPVVMQNNNTSQVNANLPHEEEAPIDLDLVDEEFSQVPLHLKSYNVKPSEISPEENWAEQEINKIKIETPKPAPTKPAPRRETPTSIENDFEKYMIPEGGDLGQIHIQSDGEFEEISFANPHSETKVSTPKPAGLSATESVLIEKVTREEARAIIEEMCWKILPEITERVVREEISKLLQEAEKNL